MFGTLGHMEHAPDEREAMLIILGAGASWDCVPGGLGSDKVVNADGLPGLPLGAVRPPLTQRLAAPEPLQNQVLDKWPQARPVVDHLRRSLTTHLLPTNQHGALTLETALRDYRDSEAKVPEVERHIVATRFYLRDLLWACTDYMHSPDLTGGVTNQLTLLGKALGWAGGGKRCVVVVSFNYDLIVERAMASLWGFDTGNLAAYLAHDRVILLKPHGSVQWQWPVDHELGRQANSFFSLDGADHSEGSYDLGRRSIDLALSDGIDKEGLTTIKYAAHQWPKNGRSVPAGIPALGLPLAGKEPADLVWPQEQENTFRALAGRVSRILTIGWRAEEPHFLDLLTPLPRSDARVVVVARDGGEATAIRDILLPKLGLGNDNSGTFPDGFSQFVVPGCDRLKWIFDD